MTPTSYLINLIETKTLVLWLITVREAKLWDKEFLLETACPMSRDRAMITYFHYSSEDLQEELMDINERMNLLLEHIDLHQISDILP